ncbi:hypothetical protein [Paraburkholderia caribensis]|uniref:hypothetical protein n=1 Tax=Paraburkholderia caribensis TaxID=75105 RepID=UPI0007C826D2|nr:hypothetical protein [Paraburkholderia caribensis]
MAIARRPADDVLLERWSIRETNHGEKHFVGWSTVDCEARVSTAIQTFDPAARTGTTASGSRYRLVGRAGHDGDAEYVWRRAAEMWDVTSWTDVTPSLVPDFRNARPLAGLIHKHEEGAALAQADELRKSRLLLGSEPTGRLAMVRYRLTAYDVQSGHNRSPSALRANIIDEGEVVVVPLDPPDGTLEFLTCVKILLGRRLAADPACVLSGSLPYRVSIFVESLQPEATSGELAARLILSALKQGVCAKIYLDERPPIDLGPLRAREDENIWDTVLRFLPGEKTERGRMRVADI